MSRTSKIIAAAAVCGVILSWMLSPAVVPQPEVAAQIPQIQYADFQARFLDAYTQAVAPCPTPINCGPGSAVHAAAQAAADDYAAVYEQARTVGIDGA